MEQIYTRLSSFSLKGLSPSARKPKGKERKTVWSLQRERFKTAQSRHYILATRIRPFLPGQWTGDRAGPRQRTTGPLGFSDQCFHRPMVKAWVCHTTSGQYPSTQYYIKYWSEIFLLSLFFFFFARVSLEVHTVSVSRRLILVGIFLCSFSSFTLGRVGFSLCRSLFMEKSMDKSEELKNKQQQNKTKQTNKNLPAPQTPLRCPHR